MRQRTDDEILEDLKDWPVRNIYVERGVRLIEQLRQRVAELEKERDDWQDEALGSRINVETLRAERDDAITNLRVEQIAHLSLTDLLEKENEQLKSALREAKSALLLTQEGSEFAACLPDEWSYAADKDNEQIKEALAKINEVLK